MLIILYNIRNKNEKSSKFMFTKNEVWIYRNNGYPQKKEECHPNICETKERNIGL